MNCLGLSSLAKCTCPHRVIVLCHHLSIKMSEIRKQLTSDSYGYHHTVITIDYNAYYVRLAITHVCTKLFSHNNLFSSPARRHHHLTGMFWFDTALPRKHHTLMLGKRRRRCANMKTTLSKRLVFTACPLG